MGRNEAHELTWRIAPRLAATIAGRSFRVSNVRETTFTCVMSFRRPKSLVDKRAAIAEPGIVDQDVGDNSIRGQRVTQLRDGFVFGEVGREDVDLQRRVFPGEFVAQLFEPRRSPGDEHQRLRAGGQLPRELASNPRGSAGDQRGAAFQIHGLIVAARSAPASARPRPRSPDVRPRSDGSSPVDSTRAFRRRHRVETESASRR